MNTHHSLYTFIYIRFIDIMSKAIQDLLALVKLLREEVAHQTNEINHLRRLIENCAGCRETAPIIKENCDNSNPCYDGVQCYDTSNGVRCGRCPSGTLSFSKSLIHIILLHLVCECVCLFFARICWRW